MDYHPDRTPQGLVRGFLVSYSDVDNLKRLELEAGQREHRLRLVTDSVGLPILYFDRQLKVRFANKPFGNCVASGLEERYCTPAGKKSYKRTAKACDPGLVLE